MKSWTITKVTNGLKVTPKGSKALVTGKPKKAGKVRFSATVRAVDGQWVKQTFTIAVR
ncbi:hypothetical protein [Paenarthrobacter sp. C1]|uniref:hypothetical protein n=1 Tax=Paenarthrobacter sp. C1 TaxID=3400220 RepID=UPI003BF536A8